jgi:peptidyl-prolyl cis-trans isomerase A (cyclophilin A)
MQNLTHQFNFCLLVLFLFAATSPSPANTVMRVSTVLGDFDIQLFDEQTPLTVANFLNYVQNGKYDGSFFHRCLPGFVLQGGGFFIESNESGNYITPVDSDPPVINEPGVSNLRGTLAMAKLGDNPDSATNQWFINLADNSANLDFQNGGFTVFGKVIGDGMIVVDALAAVQTYNVSKALGPAFTDLPLLEPALEVQNLLFINKISKVPFAVRTFGWNAGRFEISWTGSGEAPVVIERSTSLAEDDWLPISVDNTSGAFTDLDPPPLRAFYRLRLNNSL